MNKHKKIRILTFLAVYFCAYVFARNCYAAQINIVYTGQTHAMLYTCSCPVEKDGGVARRAACIKEIRAKNPNTLVLDSGNFFAGGLLDEYTQNTDLDMKRTNVNLQAMELMEYDALAVGPDEFNFGMAFFREKLAKTKLAFLSADFSYEKVLPYLVKEMAGVKIGIIGLTNPRARQKAVGLDFKDPKEALRETLIVLKQNNAAIIIVLSNLEEADNLDLVKDIGGIDILITNIKSGQQPYNKIGSSLVLNPAWQGRRLGNLTLDLQGDKITGSKIDLINLSDKIKDDPAIEAILPRCFSNAECKDKNGALGTCLDPGTMKAACKFEEHKKVRLFLITAKKCVTCDPQPVVTYLKRYIPGLTVTRLEYPGRKADKLIKDLEIKSLPAYIFGKEVEEEKNFSALKEGLEAKGEYYLAKPQVSGLSYLLGRPQTKGKIDLFISLYDDNAPAVLDAIKDFKPQVHFLVTQGKDGFEAMKGQPEVEEYLRCACVKKYYPDKFWDYITCRAKNINSSWWDACLDADGAIIKICALGPQGTALLSENIQLNQELMAMFGTAYLMNNQEVFATQGAPKKEELEKIFRKR